MTQPEYKKEVDNWVDAHIDQMLEDLKTLVRIPSIRGEAKEGMPYGEMPAKAVCAMQKLMEQYGLHATNYENYCVAGDLDAEGKKALDILAHLDVVPVSDSWTKTAPFDPLVLGDRIYGRGTIDDKGPAIAALYAMRCIRELGLPLKYGVRLICGSDEECGSSDLEYYYSREKEALYTFSPDADYPLINIEKGRLQKSFRATGSAVDEDALGRDDVNQDVVDSEKKAHVKCIRVGSAANIVPGTGTMILTGVSEEMLHSAAEKMQEAAGELISWSKQGEDYVVTASGRSSHAAHPVGGINSVTLILELLKQLDRNCAAGGNALFSSDGMWSGRNDAPGENMLLRIGSLWPHGEFHGESLEVNYSDEESGALTMSLDVLDYRMKEDGRFFELQGTFDCRAPLCCNDGNLTQKIHEKLEAAGLEMEDGPMVHGHYVSAESVLVKKLLESYELYFEEKGTTIAIGGGTYVHELERGVAFGCADLEVDNHMHGDDEFMEIPMLVRSTKVFADAIMRLCGRVCLES